MITNSLGNHMNISCAKKKSNRVTPMTTGVASRLVRSMLTASLEVSVQGPKEMRLVTGGRRKPYECYHANYWRTLLAVESKAVLSRRLQLEAQVDEFTDAL